MKPNEAAAARLCDRFRSRYDGLREVVIEINNFGGIGKLVQFMGPKDRATIVPALRSMSENASDMVDQIEAVAVSTED